MDVDDVNIIIVQVLPDVIRLVLVILLLVYVFSLMSMSESSMCVFTSSSWVDWFNVSVVSGFIVLLQMRSMPLFVFTVPRFLLNKVLSEFD